VAIAARARVAGFEGCSPFGRVTRR
jgi:hypothetical protein